MSADLIRISVAAAVGLLWMLVNLRTNASWLKFVSLFCLLLCFGVATFLGVRLALGGAA